MNSGFELPLGVGRGCDGRAGEGLGVGAAEVPLQGRLLRHTKVSLTDPTSGTQSLESLVGRISKSYAMD